MRSFLLAATLLVACTTTTPPSAPAIETPLEIVHEPIGPSIYDLDLRLRDAAGTDIGIDIARGHRTLLSMFYASCPVACPVLLSELDRIASELPPDAARDLRIVVVSFDPRDTPERLAALARERKLDERWVLVAASDADARTLAAAIGFRYRKLDNGEYFHSATILALDEEGQPLAKTERLGHHEALLAVLR